MVLLDQSSPCGVYDQAIEASAGKLMLAARESNSSSGYASDADTLESQETAGDLVSFSSSASLKSISECSEDDSIESEIAFLQQKQSLLEKALVAMKRAETYDASKARDVVNGRVPAEAPIWKEAKEILDVLKMGDGNNKNNSRKSDSCSSAQNRRRSKRPRIDVSSVLCQSATDADRKPTATSSFDRIIPNRQVLWSGHWVAQAMAQSMDFSRSPTQPVAPGTGSTWEVMNDPDLGPLVVSPLKSQFKTEIQLKDALSFTPNAKIVTLPTPPFFVVHANKAFSVFSSLQNGDVVGKPVDAVIQVSKDEEQEIPGSASARAAPSSPPFTGMVVGTRKTCQVKLTPVSDHYRNPQSKISHLLIELEPSRGSEQGDTRGFEVVEFVDKPSAVTSSRTRPSPHNDLGFGTVG